MNVCEILSYLQFYLTETFRKEMTAEVSGCNFV